MLEAFVPAVMLLAIVKKLIDLGRYARGGWWSDFFTQLITYVVATLVIVLAAETDFAGGFVVGDTGMTLDQLNGWSLIFVGLGVGSTASLVNDALPDSANPRPSLVSGNRTREPR